MILQPNQRYLKILNFINPSGFLPDTSVMKKVLLLVAIFFLSVFSAFAQKYEDVVYLKNGSIIHGIIIEQVINESLKIQTRDGNVFVFDIADVQKITKEIPKTPAVFDDEDDDDEKDEKSGAWGNFNNPRGYLGLVEYQIPTVFLGSGAFGVDYVNGYRVCPQFAVGIGLGFETFCFKNIQIPLYLHLRSDILKMRVSPYIAFNVGYNFDVSGGFDVATDSATVWYYMSGVFFKPQVGVSYNLKKNNRMTVGLSFNFQKVSKDSYMSDGYYTSSSHSSYWDIELFGISVGFSF